MSDVTRFLSAIEQGDAKATDQLLPLVYDELRRLAAQKLAHEKPGQTLQATALVHEAYVRLVGDEHSQWENGRHFFAAAAEAMRRILIRHARYKARASHGDDWKRAVLRDVSWSLWPSLETSLAVDEAVNRLAEDDPQVVDIVELHFFCGNGAGRDRRYPWVIPRNRMPPLVLRPSMHSTVSGGLISMDFLAIDETLSRTLSHWLVGEKRTT